MKRCIIFLFYTLCVTKTFKTFSQVNIQDSLALVDFYDSTNGTTWTSHYNWLTTEPLGTWNGVTVENNRVTVLHLYGDNLSGFIPSSIGNLTNLNILDLGENKIAGSLPSSIGNLTNLNTLSLRENKITGSIPSSMGNLSNLVMLELSYNQLNGIIPSSLANLTKLNALDLSFNQLTGTVPAFISDLSQLTFLSLEDNQLTGGIPSSLGNLSNLTSLVLGQNLLEGSIPASLGNLANLRGLALNSSSLTGNIPASLGNLSNLQELYLGNNQLTGSIPPSIGNLSNMQYLSFSSNNLSDSIPATLANFSKLGGLYLSYNEFTFAGMEQLVEVYGSKFSYYAPQANIPLHYTGNTLSVSAGGTLANDTFHWYKNGELINTVSGDSTLQITEPGNYSVTVTNAFVTQLTLYSDTVNTNILPVSLLSFIAQKQNNTTLLHWQTADEINNSYFSIERSSNTNTFTAIGSKQALNNTNHNSYSFVDDAPLNGMNYYRLKQVDKDGKSAYSSIVSANFTNSSSAFVVFPNPANSSVNITIPASNLISEIVLYNITGKAVMREQIAAYKTSVQLNISKPAPGIYNVVLIQNGKQQSIKLVKK